MKKCPHSGSIVTIFNPTFDSYLSTNIHKHIKLSNICSMKHGAQLPNSKHTHRMLQLNKFVKFL
jgi:hypothetical protein